MSNALKCDRCGKFYEEEPERDRDIYIKRLEEVKKMDSEFLTVKEVAKMLDMPVQTVYSWIHDCKIPAEKFGNQYVIHKSDLVEMGYLNGYTDEDGELFIL